VFRGLRRRTSSPQARLTRSVLVVALALLTPTGLVLATGASPAAAKADHHTSHAARPQPAKAYTLPAVRNTVAHSSCRSTPTKTCPHTNPVWSGYVITPVPNHPFTNVSGSWIQTSAKCPQPNAWALFWVGLDGYAGDPSTVEQGGTSAECVNGIPQYQAWWEMYPTNTVQLTYSINVGDHMSSSVAYDATAATYTITVTDNTTGSSLVAVSNLAKAQNPNPNTYTVTVNGVTTGPTSYAPSTVCAPTTPCGNLSAEWIVEAPAGNGTASTLYPLAHFRRVTFTDSNAVDSQGDSGPIISTNWQNAGFDLMTTSGTFLASVTQVKKSGTRFKDVWDPGQL
jgi:hypothetical protein